MCFLTQRKENSPFIIHQSVCSRRPFHTLFFRLPDSDSVRVVVDLSRCSGGIGVGLPTSNTLVDTGRVEPVTFGPRFYF